MDEDARQHDELREKYSLQERRVCLMQAEMEELRGGLEASERARKQIEQELVDTTERFSEISMQVGGSTGRPGTHKHTIIITSISFGVSHDFLLLSFSLVNLFLSLQNQSLTILKRKLEADLARLCSENEELISEFRAADERAKKAVTDVSCMTTHTHTHKILFFLV